MKYMEFTGKTVDDAVEKGLKELGISKENADIKVLEEGKKKLFGSIKARVEIAVKCEEKAEEKLKELREWRYSLKSDGTKIQKVSQS